jgi:hypothetical protein
MGQPRSRSVCVLLTGKVRSVHVGQRSWLSSSPVVCLRCTMYVFGAMQRKPDRWMKGCRRRALVGATPSPLTQLPGNTSKWQ